MNMPRIAPPALLVATAAVTACAGPVTVPEQPIHDQATAQRCTTLVGALPTTLDRHPRREVQPGRLTRAWGDPPITVTCGEARPPATGEACFEVNGVGWTAQQGNGGWVFTSFGRDVTVSVGVPSAYTPEANALTDLAGPITAHSTALTRCQ